jgi:uncharacterized protein (DUF2062 family)
MRIFRYIKNKILVPFRLVPADGLTAGKLAFSVTIGIVSGLFPVIGTTTLISLLLTMIFRQNLLVVQSVQWMVGIIQVFLIIPFMRFGAYLLSQNKVHISIEQVKLAFQPGILSGLKTIGIFHLYAILTWLIVVIPLGVLSFYVFRYVFRLGSQKI